MGFSSSIQQKLSLVEERISEDINAEEAFDLLLKYFLKDFPKKKIEKQVQIILNGETDIEKKLNFIPQFQRQMKDLEEREVLIVQNGVKGIKGWDGNFYKAPTEQEILAKERAFDQRLLAYKIHQNMRQVLLVDFASSWVTNLTLLTEYYRKAVGSVSCLFRTDYDQTKLTAINSAGFCFGKDEDNLLYLPRAHELSTKAEVVGNGFKILLLPDNPCIPRELEGKDPGGRHDLEANKSGNTYREFLTSEDPTSIYCGEQGLTIEAWVVWAFFTLREQRQVLHDFRQDSHEHKNYDSACWLTGTQLKNGKIPIVGFSDITQKILLMCESPEYSSAVFGGAGSVEIY